MIHITYHISHITCLIKLQYTLHATYISVSSSLAIGKPQNVEHRLLRLRNIEITFDRVHFNLLFFFTSVVWLLDNNKNRCIETLCSQFVDLCLFVFYGNWTWINCFEFFFFFFSFFDIMWFTLILLSHQKISLNLNNLLLIQTN